MSNTIDIRDYLAIKTTNDLSVTPCLIFLNCKNSMNVLRVNPLQLCVPVEVPLHENGHKNEYSPICLKINNWGKPRVLNSNLKSKSQNFDV